METVETILELSDSEKKIIFNDQYKRGSELTLLKALQEKISDKKMINDVLFKSILSLDDETLKKRSIKEGVYDSSLTWGETVLLLYEKSYEKITYPSYFKKIEPNLPRDTFRDYRILVSKSVRLNDSYKEKAVVTLEDIHEEVRYGDGKGLLKPSVHLGQRKLLLSEVQFLTRIERDNKGEYVVVYAGAAPSHHTGFLSTLFPRAKFLLVDPNDFDVNNAKPLTLTNNRDVREGTLATKRYMELCTRFVREKNRIQIINSYFTQELAEVITDVMGSGSTYFISDIRTNVVGRGTHTFDIIWNNCQQYNWIKTMEPVLSLLKFRHPFYNERDEEFYEKYEDFKEDFIKSEELGLDFLENFKKKEYVYFDGVVNIQAFPGQTSAETRLLTDGKSLKNYGKSKEYEDKLCYYNLVSRSLRLHKNENASLKDGFDHCNDCALENQIWKDYIHLTGSKKKVLDYVYAANKSTWKGLLIGNHGKFFKNYTEREVLTMSM